jgi:hypothetical protein
MRTLKDELKKAGFNVPEVGKKVVDLLPCETEMEIKSHLTDVTRSIYHTPVGWRTRRTRVPRPGKVDILEVKKIMASRPVDKNTYAYRILDLATKYEHVTVKLLERKLNETEPVPGIKVAVTTIMSPLVRFVRAGVMHKKETYEGRVKSVQYFITEADKKLGTDAIYAKYRSACGKDKKQKGETIVTDPGLRQKFKNASFAEMYGMDFSKIEKHVLAKMLVDAGASNTLKVEVSGNINVTFKLG